jgi:hypothetical protein
MSANGTAVEPLTAKVGVETVDRIVNVLLAALRPQVEFKDDFEAMRQDAERARVFHIETALALLYTNVAGIQVQPRAEEIVEKIGSATLSRAGK